MSEPTLAARAELDSFLARCAFAPDAFQRRAMDEITRENSVLVCAPTGAGKTLIAEYAIWLALSRQRRVVYTTPLKALSNQKFADFQAAFGEERVGLLTGDVKVNSDAPVLVMTTEILRNILFTSSIPGLEFIVLDEFHYLGDEGRGTVWEEIVVHAPRSARLVALSATVGNVDELARWISEAHGPVVPIVETNRPVPLDFRFYTAEGMVVSEHEVASASRRARPQPRGVAEQRRRGRFGRERRGFRPDAAKVIAALRERSLLPCLYFIFSRAGCEIALESVLGRDVDLLTAAEKARVEEEIAKWQEQYPGLSAGSTVWELVTSGLRRGLGVHHAGILPALKRLTERLFEQNLCQVVFATETMSLGIHMPARSVFLQELRKRGEAGFRGLTAGEITQMAGRAGRRGIDSKGTCLVGIEDVRTAPEQLRIIHGPVDPIQSRFQLRYSSTILLLATEPSLLEIRATLERSFAQFQRRRQIGVARSEVDRLLAQKAEAEAYEAPCGDVTHVHRYHAISSRLEAARQDVALSRRDAPKRGRQGWHGPVDLRARLEAMGKELAMVPCADCRWKARPRCESAVKLKRRAADRLDHEQSRLKSMEDSTWDLFLRVTEVLSEFGFVEESTYKITPAGRLIGDLRHENELMVAEAARSGALAGLTTPELAAVLSCLVEGGREGGEDPSEEYVRKRPHLKKRLDQLARLRDGIDRAQRNRRVTLPLHLQTSYMAAAAEWAGGTDDWLGVVTGAWGGHEGDLIRAFRRLIDLARQLADSHATPAMLAPEFAALVPKLDRGIVLDSALL